MPYIPTPATFKKLGFHPAENANPSDQPVWYHDNLARGFSAAKRLITLNSKTGFVQLHRIEAGSGRKKLAEKRLESEQDLINLISEVTW